jgi:sterol desaturase/sphingolipid hydroxylase (fatty acid hydroxylase superfamily)
VLHRYDALWRLHKVHHSSRVLDWLATTRAHVLEHLFRGVPVQAALFTLGVPTSALAVAISIYAAFATLGHSNLRLDLSRLEWLFITPRIHHLHHAPETTHQNFGTVFSLWDRAAGRLVIQDADAGEQLGVPGELEGYPQTWLRQLAEPFRRVGASETKLTPGERSST